MPLLAPSLALLFALLIAPLLACAPPEPPLREEPLAPRVMAPAAQPPSTEGMILVPGGTFTRGSTGKRAEPNEGPLLDVTLGPFWIDRTEVTAAAYRRCIDEHRCAPLAPPPSKHCTLALPTDGLPINCVAHEEAAHFCLAHGKRLPTEAEWEKAARGAEGRRYPWGSEFPTREHGVFGEGTTADVGTRPRGKGPYGHLDLAGNVWEWVQDFYDPYAYRRPRAAEGIHGTCEETLETFTELRRSNMHGFTGTNPIPTECEKGLRGGAFNYNARGLRSSNRVHHPGRFRLVMSGFRCARDL